jgi:hypothetical protein
VVQKVCEPSTDTTSRFTFVLSGVVQTQFNNVACGFVSPPQSVTPGSVTITEFGGNGTTLSDFATRIDCTGRGTVFGTQTTITVGAGEQITCTFTNSRTTMTVAKQCIPSTDLGKFTLRIESGPTLIQEFVDVSCGFISDKVAVPVGEVTVREVAGTGTILTDYSTTISCNDPIFVNATVATIDVAGGQNVTCTFTNTRRPKITVFKDCTPPTDPFVFPVNITGVPVTNVSCGGSFGPVFVTPGTVVISETVNLAIWSVVIDCRSNFDLFLPPGAVRRTNGPSLTMTVLSGEDIVCYIFNTRRL